MSDATDGRTQSTAALVAILVGLPALNAHVLIPWVERHDGASRGVWWADGLVLLVLHLAALVLVRKAVALERPSRTQTIVGLGILAAGALSLTARQLGVYHATYTNALSPTNGLERAGYLVTGIVIGGVQEPLWRGFAFQEIRARWRVSVAAAVAITSISFGYYHGGLGAPGNAVFIGVAAGGMSLLYLRTKTLWWPIFVHVGFNVFTTAFA